MTNNTYDSSDGRQATDLPTATSVETRTFTHMLPARPGTCPECAHNHEPAEPHNRHSLYYQMRFHQAHGRWPDWADAMAHCDAETQARWSEALLGSGQGLGGDHTAAASIAAAKQESEARS